MKIQLQRANTGSTIICALFTILILSLIGANVLLNCTTRYNVSSKQVKGWKEALYAAEGGGDIAFSEVRKPYLISPSTAFSASNGWTTTAGPSYTSYSRTDGEPYSWLNNSLSAKVTVDRLTATLNGQPQDYYRIRSQGTATLLGLPRVGMDDRMDNVTKGDSLLRKIDFKYDHFKAKYGDGDGNGKVIAPVLYPQITRRIETIAVPQFLTTFTGAVRTTGTFVGPGASGLIDSYDSKNGPYTFVANNPASPLYADSQNGNVSDGTSSFTEFGPIYGNVTTNGGTVTSKSNGTISGTIDNTVPFTVPPLVSPWSATASGWTAGSSATITLPSTAVATDPNFQPAQYVYSSLTSGITINPYVDPLTGVAQETYVKIVVNGDVDGNITIANHVNAQISFTGNLSLKNANVVNNNVDDAVPTNPSRAAHLQFYGISPTDGSTQTVSITPPGSLYASIYAPSADVTVGGGADIYGAIVCHNYSGNGGTTVHYDKEIAQLLGVVTDYRIASYIEDVR
jgi:hypothetical protein